MYRIPYPVSNKQQFLFRRFDKQHSLRLDTMGSAEQYIYESGEIMRKLKDSVVLHHAGDDQDSRYVLQQGNKYYELSKETFDIISLLQQGREEADVISELQERKTGIEASEMEALIDYLEAERLFEGQQESQKKRLSDMWGKKKLLTPEKISRLPSFKFMFKTPVMITVFLLMSVWLIEVINKECFFRTIGYLSGFSFGNYLLVFLIIVGISLAHETGHVMALRYHGCTPGDFGCGFYITFPSFYVDVSQANLLPDSKRVMVDIGGIYFQITVILLLVAANLWLQSESVAFACYLSTLMAIANLLPFTKSDGYFIFCDWLGSSDPFHDAISLLKKRKEIHRLTRKELGILFFSLIYASCMTALVVSCLLRVPVSFSYLSKVVWKIKSDSIYSLNMSLNSIITFVLNVLPSLVVILFAGNIIRSVCKETAQ